MCLLEKLVCIVFVFDSAATDRKGLKVLFSVLFLADSGGGQFKVAFRNCT